MNMKRTILLCAATILTVALAGAAWRLTADGRGYLDRARSVEMQDPLQAALWYGEAMRAYVPLHHPHVEEAHAALAGMARRAEAQGNLRGALDAWREIHASLRAVRSFYQPHADWLDQSASEIARLKAAAKEAAHEEPAPPSEAAEPSGP